ncbi:MAG: hypothetical protein E6K97_03305 [Thaumarchaeota archaeon]|nr:MAG: hypothetical protein E6K97_03305 [Nitrososphaerota archaeon]
MDFEKLEKRAYEANVARSQNMKLEAIKIEAEILKNMTENQFLFPVEEEVLMTKNSASFVYKNSKTYPSLLEFIGRILHVDIPIKLNECKIGPGGIIISAESKEQAHKILHDCCHELQILIKAKKGHID